MSRKVLLTMGVLTFLCEANDCGRKLGLPRWSNWFSNIRVSHETLFSEVVKGSEESPQWAEDILDGLALHWLSNFRKGRVLMTLMVGNPYRSVPMRFEGDVRQFILRSENEGYTILYDADSLAAHLFRDVAGRGRAIGISQKFSSKSNFVVKITNPFLRMKFFEMAEKIVVTPISPPGLGLLLDGRGDYVFDPSDSWTYPLERKDDTRRAHVWPRPPVIRSFSEKLVMKHPPQGGGLPSWDFKEELMRLEILELKELLEYADLRGSIRSNLESLRLPDGSQAARAGFLGWSVDHKDYHELVFNSVGEFSKRQFAIVTGGSGGYMRVANAAAKHHQGFSIGLPFVGMMRLNNESVIPREVHTHTFPTNNYPVRIGSLLENDRYIIVAPGSSGTMQELAAALFELNNSKKTSLALISGSFYSDLYDWMIEQGMPRELSERVYLIKSSRDVGDFLDGK